MTRKEGFGVLAVDFAQSEQWGFRAAADAVSLPKLEPGAMREHFIVPSIRSREVAWAQRSRIRRHEQPLKRFDFANDPLNIHGFEYSQRASSLTMQTGSTLARKDPG